MLWFYIYIWRSLSVFALILDHLIVLATIWRSFGHSVGLVVYLEAGSKTGVVDALVISFLAVTGCGGS